jgi:hypothetical protein
MKRYYVYCYSTGGTHRLPDAIYCTDSAEKAGQCVAEALVGKPAACRAEVLDSLMILPLPTKVPIDLDCHPDL